MFVDDPCQRSERLVDLARIGKHQRHVGLKHDNDAARFVPRGIFVGLGVTEIVLGQDFVCVDYCGFSFPGCSLYVLSVPDLSPAER